jgi:hypothetical protein
MARRYQRVNQKPKIKEIQTIQWPEDTKGLTRSRKSKKYRQYNGQKKKDRKTIYKTLLNRNCVDQYT